MDIDSQKINQMYNLMNANISDFTELSEADGTVVFCRLDALVAEAAANVYYKSPAGVDYVLFSGGIGKDSGILKSLGVPEAKFQAALANSVYGVPEKNIYCETESTNGGENCRNSIGSIEKLTLPHETLVLIAHATSARRLSETFKHEAAKLGFNAKLQTVATDYVFNPFNPADQKEVVAELLRLADWPAKGWLAPQDDLKNGFAAELVEYARVVDAYFKKA